MFAAAAVAAAAALTAISTSTAVGNTDTSNNQSLQKQQQQLQQNQQHVSWHQYAMQRRNSLQRRKFEIDKRIKQASAANNKNKTHFDEIKQFQPIQTTNSNTKNLNFSQSLETTQRPVLTYQYAVDHDSLDYQQIEFIKSLKNNNQLDSEKEAWIKGLSSEVFNEFIKLYNERKSEYETENFEDITNALLDYLQTNNNLNEKSQLIIDLNAVQHSSNRNQLDYKKATLLATVHKKPSRNSKQRYDSLRYKWNPKWLRLLRKTTCLPVAIITLLLLIFTNLSSNWIYIEGKLLYSKIKMKIRFYF